MAATKAPICFIGTGEHVKDIERFDPESFVSRLLGMGDIKQLEDINSHIPTFFQNKVKFTFRDMDEILKNLMEMPMSIENMMQFLPKLNLRSSKDQPIDWNACLKKWEESSLTACAKMN